MFGFLTAIACLTALAGCITNSPSASRPSSVTGQKNTYVIVHGAWGGGWDWKRVADWLTADGNTVYRPTLTGLGEHSNLAGTNIDLDTHIQDIVNVIRWENLHNVVLVGHSYGGMVITGVADRVPGRIKRVVYLDAFLPANGESVDALLPPGREFPVKDGFVMPFWVKGNPPLPHDLPQPARTFSEPITLTNQVVAEKLPATYILTVDRGKTPEQDDFYPFYERARVRGWTTLIMEGNHIVERSRPKAVAELLEQMP